MKNKLIIAGVLITSTIIFSSPVLAEGDDSEEVIIPIKAELPEVGVGEPENGDKQEHASNYIRTHGVIKKIVKDGDDVTLIVEDEEKSLETHFPINKDIPAYSSATTNAFAYEDLEEGQQIEVFYNKNKPIMMIYPAIIVPELIVVHDAEQIGNVKVGKFDEEWFSLDGELILHISDETELLNQTGEQVTKEDLVDQELLVFYTISTLSLPGQTAPTKIIALDPLVDEQGELEQLIEEDHYMKNDTKMIPLRKVAEFLGNEVIWHQETYSITLKKENRTLTLSIGEEMYGYNKSLRYFEYAPELKDNKTYVPESLIDLIVQ